MTITSTPPSPTLQALPLSSISILQIGSVSNSASDICCTLTIHPMNYSLPTIILVSTRRTEGGWGLEHRHGSAITFIQLWTPPLFLEDVHARRDSLRTQEPTHACTERRNIAPKVRSVAMASPAQLRTYVRRYASLLFSWPTYRLVY